MPGLLSGLRGRLLSKKGNGTFSIRKTIICAEFVRFVMLIVDIGYTFTVEFDFFVRVTYVVDSLNSNPANLHRYVGRIGIFFFDTESNFDRIFAIS